VSKIKLSKRLLLSEAYYSTETVEWKVSGLLFSEESAVHYVNILAAFGLGLHRVLHACVEAPVADEFVLKIVLK